MCSTEHISPRILWEVSQQSTNSESNPGTEPRGRREKTQTSALGWASSPGSVGFVHMPLPAPLTAPLRGAAAGAGVHRQHWQQCLPRDEHTDHRHAAAQLGMCLSTQWFLHLRAVFAKPWAWPDSTPKTTQRSLAVALKAGCP